MESSLPLLGAFWGAVSAVSLPLGASAGLLWRPPRRLVSGLMAFGAGALLFALSIELFGHALHTASDVHGRIERHGILIVTILAALLGGLLFQGLNRLLGSLGAHRRKRSLIRRHIAREKRRAADALLKTLSRIDLFRRLPPEEFVQLIPRVGVHQAETGEVLFRQGDPGDRLYAVASGKVEILREDLETGESVAVLGPGSVFGEIALLSDRPRSATARAMTRTRLLEVPREVFLQTMEGSESLAAAVQRLASDRIVELAALRGGPEQEVRAWREEALAAFEHLPVVTSPEEVRREASGHGGSAALAIWLGIALDGIPESLVIGMLVVTAAAEGAGMSLAFIAGVFLANLPEALSSSATMREGGASPARILAMWTSLCVLTALGALAGTLLFPPHPEGTLLYVLFAIEGLAGGAMLTMIAETMLPEAFEQGGGPLVGLTTLIGFLAAITVKLLH